MERERETKRGRERERERERDLCQNLYLQKRKHRETGRCRDKERDKGGEGGLLLQPRPCPGIDLRFGRATQPQKLKN